MTEQTEDIMTEDPNSPLKQPDLIPMTIEEIHQKVVREDDTILTLIVISGTQLVKDAQPTSGNIVMNAKTRAGKDHTAKEAYKVLKYNVFIHRSKISPTAFNYWHNKEPNWTWDNKQLLLEDVESNLINSPVFKTMSSGTNKATITVKNETVELEVPGKPNITCTAFNIDLKQETIGRYTIIKMDESDEQTRAIKKFMNKKAKGELDVTPNSKLLEGLKLLQKVDVVIPFADILIDLFPDTRMMRDIYGRFLDYIKSSTAIHQKQREKDNQGRLIATGDDYLIARIALMKTTANIQMISLTIKDEKVLKFLEEHPLSSKPQMIEGTGISKYYFYEGGGLDGLEQNGFVQSELILDADANKKVMKYLLPTESGRIGLPMFPAGIPIDENIKKYINEMRRNALKRKTRIPNRNTNTTYNTNGISVIRCLLNKSILYYEEDKKKEDIVSNIGTKGQENQYDLPYKWYFGFTDVFDEFEN